MNAANNDLKIPPFAIAGAYIGTVVGAGFASGQEILQFFSVFGHKGGFGVALATVLFMLFGYLVLEIGRKEAATSHRAVIRAVGGRLAPAIDFAVTFFLFGGLTAMIAGSGAIFKEEFGLPKFVGALFMAAVSLLTVLSGLKGVIKAINAFVPFLLVSVLVLCVATLVRTPVTGLQPPTAGFWPTRAVLYVSYNLLTAAAVLAPMGSATAGRKANLHGSLLGGLGLGVGALAIHLCVRAMLPALAGIEVPLLFIASLYGRLSSVVYSAVLLGEVYTTAVAGLYGFSVRLCRPDNPRFRTTVTTVTIMATLASGLGFTNLVRFVYPAAGWAGLLFMAGLAVYALGRHHRG